MGRAETNQAKREVIKGIIAALFARGWTALRLAAYTNHSTSCVSSWKLGKSMGTNDERAMMPKLPAADSAEVRQGFADKLQKVREAIAMKAANITKFQTPAYLAAERASAVAQIKDMVAYCEKHEGRKQCYNGQRWYNDTDATFAARQAKCDAEDMKHAAEYRAKLADGKGLDAEAAEHVADSIAWEERCLAESREYEAMLVKAIASYKGQAQLSI